MILPLIINKSDLAPIDLSSQVIGILPIIHGGHEADNAPDAIRNLYTAIPNIVVDPISPNAIYAVLDFDGFATGAIVDGQTLQAAILSPLGSLAYQNSVALASQVTGDLPFANIAQIATAQFLGRNTAGTGDLEPLSMATAKAMLGYEFGVASAENTISQSVSAASTFTQNITLSHSDWTNGLIIVTDTTSGNFGTGALIHFGTTTAESSGISGSINYISSSTIGSFQSRLNIGNGFVTGTAFLGAAATTTGAFRIDSVRISGTNLEIIWRNTFGTTQTINARMRYYLWRGDKDTTP